MTQAGLANELGLTGASLNHHMKILRSNRLVTIYKREIERHRIMQIFLSSIAYLFVYDLDSLPKNITRYFYPVSLEKARAVVSLLSMYSNELSSAYEIEHISDAINMISEKLSRHLITSAKSYENRTHGLGAEIPAKNPYVAEMYKLALEGKLYSRSIP
jgi:DNA-binding transcriptional ArsR family regulator